LLYPYYFTAVVRDAWFQKNWLRLLLMDTKDTLYCSGLVIFEKHLAVTRNRNLMESHHLVVMFCGISLEKENKLQNRQPDSVKLHENTEIKRN